MKNSILLMAILVFLTICTLELSHAATSWPVVAPLERTFEVKQPDLVSIKATIISQEGDPLYLFVCRTEGGLIFPGVAGCACDLDCRLLEVSKGQNGQNLLLESHNRDIPNWQSRGRLFAYELEGACADYPEYGRVRNFLLRGMRLTLAFYDVQFLPRAEHGDARLKSYQLRLTIVPSPASQRDIAQSTGYLSPRTKDLPIPRSCEIIRTGIEWPEDRDN